MKQFRGMIIWALVLAAMMAGAAYITSGMAQEMQIRLLLMVLDFMIVVLAVMIWLTGNIHWFSGISVEEAEKYTPAERKEYAWQHLKIFMSRGVGFAVLSMVLNAARMPAWIDVILFVFVLISAVLRSMRFQI